MKQKKEEFSETSLGSYPVSRLIALAEAQAEQEKLNVPLDISVSEKKLRLIKSPEFMKVYLPVCIGPDIDITIPSSGQKFHMLRGSEFAVDQLQYLEDTALTGVLKEYQDYFGQHKATGRNYFLDQMINGAILLATIDIPNDLTKADILNLTQHFLSDGVYHYTGEGNWYKSAIFLYGCGQIMANRLDYPIENKQVAGGRNRLFDQIVGLS
jgi:hypothetical protein